MLEKRLSFFSTLSATEPVNDAHIAERYCAQLNDTTQRRAEGALKLQRWSLRREAEGFLRRLDETTQPPESHRNSSNCSVPKAR